jgi:uncharacterized RDD family membrane protein YckC
MEIRGDASKRRFFAANVDVMVALLPAMIVASNLPDIDPLLRGVSLCVIYLAYFIVCEAVWGKTLGKLLFGLHVRRLDGGPCSREQAVIRGLLRVVDANPLILGGLPAVAIVLLTKRRQRLGDLLAGTVVTRTRPDPERGDPTAVTAFD